MWIVFSLIQSVTASFHAIYMKRLVDRYQAAAVGSLTFAMAIPLLLAATLASPPENIRYIFWLCLLGTSLLNIAANYMMYRAYELENVSFLAPIGAFNPVMTMIVSTFTLGEVPKPLGIAGVFLIVTGSVILSKTDGVRSHISLLRLFQRKGVQLMLATFLIWAFTPTLEKTALLSITPKNPAYLALGMCLIIAPGLGIIAYGRGHNVLKSFAADSRQFMIIGILLAIAMLASFSAFASGYVGYAVAVMRTNIFFSILFARVFLGERGIRSKLWASGFMFAGILLFTL